MCIKNWKVAGDQAYWSYILVGTRNFPAVFLLESLCLVTSGGSDPHLMVRIVSLQHSEISWKSDDKLNWGANNQGNLSEGEEQ